MSSSLILAILGMVAQLITEVPTVIADLEKLLAAAKGQAPTAPQPPLQPQVDAEMAAEDLALKTPIVPAKS